MARPLWSGTIQISLVGFAVEIYPATSTGRPISFREIDRNTLARIHRQNVSAGPEPAEYLQDVETPGEGADISTGQSTSLHIAPVHMAPQAKPAETPRDTPAAPSQHTVEKADIVKGYEYEKGKYAIVEPAELKNLRLAGKKTIEITQFSKATEIDPALYEKPYFVMPKAGPQATAFAVVRQSLTESGMVAVGEIVFSGRQHLMILGPPHQATQPGMMLYTLRFATELRDPREYSNNLETIQADAAQLSLAKQLIDAYTQPFAVSNFKDHYEEALRELVEAKIKHLPVAEPEAEKKPAKVVDLMDALRRSLAQTNTPQAAVAGGQSNPAMEPKRERPPKKPSATSAGKAKPAAATSARKPRSA
jgi:DNA end-binding protein Ku